jgi:glycosyltransferase involved in cell wall biosynthesis
MLRDEPLVSVVTPVYNGEGHLRECIESVLAQTYSNWRYTIVNNCSNDKTLEIAREYAARDGRVAIRSNDKWIGVNENHNEAFRRISPQSKYCKLVAADEWIFPECLEKMVRLAEEHPSVAIVGAYGLCGAKVLFDGLPYPSDVVAGRELCRKTIRGFLGEGVWYFGGPTSVLYRSDIVRSRSAFFNENNLHADTEVCFEFLENHDFGFVHQVLTGSRERVREGSVSASSFRLNTGLPGLFEILVRYGPKFLSGQELKDGIRTMLEKYYRYLGEQFYKRHDKEFWMYHRRRLAEIGYPLSERRLAAAALSCPVSVLRAPTRTMAAVLRRMDWLAVFLAAAGRVRARCLRE